MHTPFLMQTHFVDVSFVRRIALWTRPPLHRSFRRLRRWCFHHCRVLEGWVQRHVVLCKKKTTSTYKKTMSTMKSTRMAMMTMVLVTPRKLLSVLEPTMCGLWSEAIRCLGCGEGEWRPTAAATSLYRNPCRPMPLISWIDDGAWRGKAWKFAWLDYFSSWSGRSWRWVGILGPYKVWERGRKREGGRRALRDGRERRS